MYKVQIYATARQAYYNDGKSQRQIALELGVNRRTVQKMLKHSVPPGYERTKPPQSRKLSDHTVWIDEILESDKLVHRKQKHTIQRIYDRLKEERDFTGGYTTVRIYVAKKRLKSREMFVPLSHDPGMAQADFGEAQVKINGEILKAHFLVMQLPFSDAMFVKAYPAENTESFVDGHQAAFRFFGGVPKRILYDNTTIAVKKILKDGQREQTTGFIGLRSHFLFEEAFATVARGNEKGGVENLVGFARRNFMVPLPNFESFEALNQHLAACCKKRQLTVVRGHEKTIADRMTKESFLPLPTVAYEGCRVQSGRVTSQGLVRFQNNDYSVPTTVGQQKVCVKGFVDRVVISYEDKVIAEHPRHYGQEEVIFNPLHYLKLLERKTGAFVQAAPLKGWNLPPIFQKVHDILYRKEGKEGRRHYIRILQFLEDFKYLGYFLHPYRVRSKRQTIQETPKFYLFDTGIASYLRRFTFKEMKGPEAGKAFEHYIFLELMAYKLLTNKRDDITYWRTKEGYEVDFIVQDMAFEVKISQPIKKPHLQGLLIFGQDHGASLHVISLETRKRTMTIDDKTVTVWPVQEFLENLWAGNLWK